MNKQNKIIVGVVALILALTIGYAVFSQSLNIKGTAKAEGSFGLIFEKSAKEPTCSGYSGGDDCSIDDVAAISGDKKTLNIIVNSLLYPTAYVKIPVLIKNTGTIDAVLESMEITGLESNDIDVKYSITDKDIENGYIVKPGDDNRKEVEVEVSWNKDSTHNSSEPISIDFSITMNYKQATNVVATTSSSSNSKCTTFTKKDTYEVGDVIAFCNTDINKSEDFYVIKDNGDTVTALARYNLMVGNKIVWDEDFNNILSTTALSKNDRDYGLQSELTKVKTTEDGLPNSTTFYGFISFAEKNGDNKNSYGDYLGYWTNMANSELGIPLEKYGTSYPANVFDENSLLWEPIQNYKSYFTSTLSKFSVNMRMITYSELLSLGCDENKNTCTRDFVYNGLNYWSATAHNASDVWYVHLYGNFFSDSDGFWKDDSLGLRPVITINKSEI